MDMVPLVCIATYACVLLLLHVAIVAVCRCVQPLSNYLCNTLVLISGINMAAWRMILRLGHMTEVE